MARRKHYNAYDDDCKATALALTEIPGVYATHVAEALEVLNYDVIPLYRERVNGEIQSLRTLADDYRDVIGRIESATEIEYAKTLWPKAVRRASRVAYARSSNMPSAG